AHGLGYDGALRFASFPRRARRCAQAPASKPIAVYASLLGAGHALGSFRELEKCVRSLRCATQRFVFRLGVRLRSADEFGTSAGRAPRKYRARPPGIGRRATLTPPSLSRVG